jgi:hypothetical protein
MVNEAPFRGVDRPAPLASCTLHAVVIYGWVRQPVLLAWKNDLCAACAMTGSHAVVHAVTWISLFFLPILPIWSSHQLICGNCGTSRNLGRRQVGEAMKSGRLPLPPREGYREFARQAFEETGRSPQESELDPIEINPSRGPWDRYLKLWLLVVPAVFVGLFIFGMLNQ